MNNKEFIASWFDCKVNNREVKRHVYGHLCADDNAVYSYGRHFPLASLCENGFLLNGDRYSSTTSSHQSLTRAVCTEACENGNLKFAVIPFTVLNSAELTPVKRIEIVDKTEEQFRDVEYTDSDGKKRVREDHLLGGSVIKYADRHFISSNDPTATWGHGYFLTELTELAKTVDEALESLKPDLVRQLEDRLEDPEIQLDLILRQGEWFFVKVDQQAFVESVRLCKGTSVMEKIAMPYEYLPSGDSSRPHHRATRLIRVGEGDGCYFNERENRVVDYGIESGFYCRGTIRHDNREHRMLKLGNGREWYLALRNRQVRSWSYDGRVD